MAKFKGKSLSEKVANGKITSQKSNPFELHFNRTKRRVLGETLRGDRGRPGFSKAKCIKLRKRTLLREQSARTKNNEFLDRRIAERASELSSDERMAQRFAAERRKQSKRDIFNLDETTELTHMGLSISSLDKYEDPRSDDDDCDDALSARFVGEAHFGGGLLSKNTAAASGDSQKEWVEQMISESKKRKQAARQSKEETLAMTEVLDQQYSQLSSHVLQHRDHDTATRSASNTQQDDVDARVSNTDSLHRSSDTITTTLPPTTDVTSGGGKVTTGNAACAVGDYDKLLRELVFTRRVAASEGVSRQSEEEAARAEKERVRQLELSRARRMHQTVTCESDHHNDADHDDVQHESADILRSSVKRSKKTKIGGAGLQLIGDRLMSLSQSDVTDDLPHCRQEQNNDVINTGAPTNSQQQQQQKQQVGAHFWRSLLEMSSVVAQLSHVQQQLASVSRADMPVFYDRLVRFVFSVASFRRDVKQSVKRVDVFVPLLFDLTCSSSSSSTALSSGRSAAGGLSEHAGDTWQRLLSVWYTSLFPHARAATSKTSRKREDAAVPGLSTLLALRVLALLFPSSDRRHPVVQPAVILMQHVLATCSATCRRHVAVVLFVCSLLVEYTELSQRYVPELICSLEGLLFSAIPLHNSVAGCDDNSSVQLKLTQLLKLPFSSCSASSRLLALSANCSQLVIEKRGMLSLLELCSPTSQQTEAPPGGEIDDIFRVSVVRCVLSLLLRLSRRHRHLPAAAELFDTAAQFLAALQLSWYPAEVGSLVEEFECVMREVRAEGKTTISRAQKRPKPLPLLEPSIENSVGGKRAGSSRTGSLTEQRRRLVRGYKRQLRSTVREIRRDSSLIGRQKLHRTALADRERQMKVKRLMSSLGNQEGEFRKMQRSKK